MCRTSQTARFGYVTERYDVIIVGSGAGGGTLAHTLAPSGKRILLLERGNFLPREIEHRSCEPRAHRHGQRDPRRRPSAEPDGVTGPGHD